MIGKNFCLSVLILNAHAYPSYIWMVVVIMIFFAELRAITFIFRFLKAAVIFSCYFRYNGVEMKTQSIERLLNSAVESDIFEVEAGETPSTTTDTNAQVNLEVRIDNNNYFI